MSNNRLKFVYIIKDKDTANGYGYYIVDIFNTEEAAILQRLKYIALGTYKAENLEIVSRMVRENV